MARRETSGAENKKYLVGALGLVLVLLCFWAWINGLSGQQNAEEYFTITAFSVGKADALLLEEGGTAVLVDTGEEEDGPDILKELEKRGIHHLDMLLITHFDKDHVGSAALMLESLSVDTVLIPDYEGDRPEYAAFMEKLEGHPDVRYITEITELSAGNLEWVIYPAADPESIQNTADEYDNDMSLVASVTYKERKFLLTGDIEKTRIAQMLDTDTDWRHDWIKMPHHGRYEKALEDLLEAVQPSQAVICCSEKKPAEEETLKLLEHWQIQVWDTSRYSVVTVCDGEQITVDYK